MVDKVPTGSAFVDSTGTKVYCVMGNNEVTTVSVDDTSIMDIVAQIERIANNVSNAYNAVSDSGGTLPDTQNTDNLETAIRSISRKGIVDVRIEEVC